MSSTFGESGANCLRRMPAEWERHEATWLQWPNPDGASFPGTWARRVEPRFFELIEWIAEVEEVRVAVASEEEGEKVRQGLSATAADQTTWYEIPTREPWCRDIGPTYVLDPGIQEGRLAVNWRFNGWGQQYLHPADEEAGSLIATADGAELEQADLVFEGGGVESDGQGAVLVTEECLLDPKRNPDLSKADAEGILQHRLGAQQVIWLTGGVTGDDTGHTDVVARFVDSGKIAVSMPEDRGHPDYALLERNLRRLQAEGYELIEFPIGDLEYNKVISDYIPKSYVNFYILNELVIVPQFDLAEDEVAMAKVAELFPTRRIQGFDSRDIAFGQGGVHCLTQQVPALPAQDVSKNERSNDRGV